MESAFSTAKATFRVSPLKRAKAVRALGEPALKGGPMRLAFAEGQTRSPLKRAVDRVKGNCSLRADPPPAIRVHSIQKGNCSLHVDPPPVFRVEIASSGRRLFSPLQRAFCPGLKGPDA